MEQFIERHASKIQGVLSCRDRIVLNGTIPGICYADGMTGFLKIQGIRIFDYTKWAEPLRDEIRVNAERLAVENGLKIHFIRKKNFRKEAQRRLRGSDHKAAWFETRPGLYILRHGILQLV